MMKASVLGCEPVQESVGEGGSQGGERTGFTRPLSADMSLSLLQCLCYWCKFLNP